MQRADIGAFILITDDRDFGDLIFNRGYPAPHAILYNRLKRTKPDAIAGHLVLLLARGGFVGQIMTITKDGERMRPFPAGASDA